MAGSDPAVLRLGHRVFQGFGCFELHSAPRRDLTLDAGLRVATDTGVAEFQLQLADAGDQRLATIEDGFCGDVCQASEDVREEFFLGTEDKLAWNDRRGFQEFDYGYAMTVHKSQGSQWNNVMVFDESRTFREDAQRWLYTAVTRAAERVTVVI